MAYGDRVVTTAKPAAATQSAKIKRRGYTVTGQLAHSAAPPAVRQANIVKVESLKNKSTLTTLKGGRMIQQVAGKSAYVVKRGTGPAAVKGKPAGRVNRSAAVPTTKKK
jgi:hypothetical protein